jgi:hypothetical protein
MNVGIGCVKSPFSAGDVHCLNGTNGGFRAGSEASALSLIGVDDVGRNISKYYSFSLLTPAQ